MKKPELSIIIPAYNAQDYIVRCVDSIIRQRGADQHEIIIVDDGSTDDTPKILDSIAETYKNIHVIHQKNSGVSVARNVGIKASHGKYVTFVDADDMVGLKDEVFDEYFSDDPRCFRYAGTLSINNTHDFPDRLSDIHFDDKYFVNMLHAAQEHKADIIFGGKIDINRDEGYMRRYHHNSEHIYSSTPEDKASTLREAEGRESANFALYSREMLKKHDLRFMANMNLDEDILFCMLAVLRANTVATVPDVTYFYDRYVGTLSNMADHDVYKQKSNIAKIQRYAVLLNEIAKMPQYMIPKIFGFWKYEYNNVAGIDEWKSPYDCDPHSCKLQNCNNCPVANSVLAHSRTNIEKYFPKYR